MTPSYTPVDSRRMVQNLIPYGKERKATHGCVISKGHLPVVPRRERPSPNWEK